MKTIYYLPLCLSVLLALGLRSYGQGNLSSNVQPSRLQRDLSSGDGAVRFHLAERLVNSHSKETFAALLNLLTDTNEDISYAAAQSIESRKDQAFARQLITTIKLMPRENVWPAYWAARSYPTPSMFSFLHQQLNVEIGFQHKRETFDNRNCFYIAQSLGQIAKHLKIPLNVTVPEGDDLSSYESFAHEITRLNSDLLLKTNADVKHTNN